MRWAARYISSEVVQAYDSILGIVCSEKTTGLHTVSLVREVHDVRECSSHSLQTISLPPDAHRWYSQSKRSSSGGYVICRMGGNFSYTSTDLLAAVQRMPAMSTAIAQPARVHGPRAEVGFGAQNRPFRVQRLLCVYQGSERCPRGERIARKGTSCVCERDGSRCERVAHSAASRASGFRAQNRPFKRGSDT